MCEHKNIVRIATGWYCPDCKRLFENRPVVEVKEEKPKKDEKVTAK